jgi:tetratricopeptide (TPR) repeat protein
MLTYRKCAILFLLLTNTLFLRAQTLEQTFSFAQAALKERNYEIARITFERVLYFDDKGLLYQGAYYGLAESLEGEGRFAEAAKSYRLASNVSSPQQRVTALFRSAKADLLAGNYNNSITDLLSMPALDDSLESKKNFFLGVSYFQYNDLNQSETYFLKASPHEDQKAQIKKLFTELKKKLKNPKTARILSIFVPGAGQLYNGDIKNALNSFLLTAGLATLFYFTAINYTIIDAYFVVFPWFQRYYMGGIKKAFLLTSNMNQKKKDRYYQLLLNQFDRER